MNRRDFVRSILGGAAAAIAAGTFDLDKALWVPGAKTFFLPEPATVEVPQLIVGHDAVKLAESFSDTRMANLGGGWRWTSRGMAPELRDEFERVTKGQYARAHDAVMTYDTQRKIVRVDFPYDDDGIPR